MAWQNPFGMGNQQPGPQQGPELVYNLINALGQSAAEANQNVAYLAQVMAQHPRGGNRGGDDRADRFGYRSLKPKKDLQKVTAHDAKTLMMELLDLEVDLGEIGTPIQSEAAYRQLRSLSSGRARDIIDLS